MKHFFTFFALTMLLLGHVAPVQAQIWSKKYGNTSYETLGGLTGIGAGGFMLSGITASGPFPTTSSLYLVRINAQGDTIWTKRQQVRAYSRVFPSTVLCENQAGQVLLGGEAGPNRLPFLMLLNSTTGDTLWTKIQPATQLSNYADVDLSANQEFVLAANLQGHPQLLRLNAAGQVSQQVAVDFSPTNAGVVQRMARVPGGYWLVIQATGGTDIKFVFVDDAGVRGVEYNGPTGIYAGTIRSFMAVESGNFLLVTTSQVYKLSATFTTLWTPQFPTVVMPYTLTHARRNTSGNYVLSATRSFGSHSVDVILIHLSASGSYSGYTACFSGLEPGISTPARLWVDPNTGNYTIASHILSNTGTTGMDLVCATFTGAAVLAATATQATLLIHLYPVPLGPDTKLVLETPQTTVKTLTLTDLTGHLVRTWPVQAASSNRYELSIQNLAVGTYYLRLTDLAGQQFVHKVVVNQ